MYHVPLDKLTGCVELSPCCGAGLASPLLCQGAGSAAGAVPPTFVLCGREAEVLSLFFQLMSAIQKGYVSGSRLAVLMKTAEENLRQRVVIPVDRSGGGL